MSSYGDLPGKRIVVTGGANGIGASMVEAFRTQGCEVDFCDIDDLRGRELADRTAARFSQVDITDTDALATWIDGAAAASAGRIDVLVNNAARDPRIEFSETTVEQWDDLIALNLRAQFFAAQTAVPHMTSGASIINFSSITVHLGSPDLPAYVATKSATIGLTRSLARRLGAKGIRVNTITPGAVMTERQLAEIVTPEMRQMLAEEQCIAELVQPDEIADVALFLASDASRAITGQQIVADHGWRHV